MGHPPTVFETVASTIPPLRHPAHEEGWPSGASFSYRRLLSILEEELIVKKSGLQWDWGPSATAHPGLGNGSCCLL